MTSKGMATVGNASERAKQKQKARFPVLNLKLVVPMKNCTRWIVL